MPCQYPKSRVCLCETINLQTLKKTALKAMLDEADGFFCPYAAGYNEVLHIEQKKKFAPESLETLFGILRKFMVQGARSLVSKEDFVAAVRANKNLLQSFEDLKLETLKDTESALQNVEKLFVQMEITKAESKLVSLSKTLHFLYPNLFVPIDGTYTLRCFHFGNTGNGFNTFRRVFDCFHCYAHTYRSELDSISKERALPIPKVIDHLIIGYISNLK